MRNLKLPQISLLKLLLLSIVAPFLFMGNFYGTLAIHSSGSGSRYYGWPATMYAQDVILSEGREFPAGCIFPAEFSRRWSIGIAIVVNATMAMAAISGILFYCDWAERRKRNEKKIEVSCV